MMRLNCSYARAAEDLTAFAAQGLDLHREGQHLLAATQTEQLDAVRSQHLTKINAWGAEVTKRLKEIFPTTYESNLFAIEPTRLAMEYVGKDPRFLKLQDRLHELVQQLDRIIRERLPLHTDFPVQEQLYIEDIDSFARARDVNPHAISDLLSGGRINALEDDVQTSIEEIIGESFHREDWGGEGNDLYSSRILVNQKRRAAAFLLKGRGCKSAELQLRDCGKNGDQLVRLFEAPATLFVIQYVGPISENVIKDAVGKVRNVRTTKPEAAFCVVDGTDTARLLRAYGKK